MLGKGQAAAATVRSLRLLGRSFRKAGFQYRSDKIQVAYKEDHFHSGVGWPDWETIGLAVGMLLGANRAAIS